MKMHTSLLILSLATGAICTKAHAESLFSLQNLERERAGLLKTLFDAEVSMSARQNKADSIQRRMVDAERMVLRDDRLTEQNSVLAKKAFERYEITFLVHASAEAKCPVLDHYLDELGLAPLSIEKAKAGYR
ncbi:hypothetical protein [Planctobacterium marinum]|uniref:Uncharacterized protein n=1 Tax=Planctobacterium marinum TaxID=1631968 RepID=A0AA48HPM7_9ALTE|nr:hypothetical protein MACH26_19080 [Planctobacterium marinum]